MLVLNPSSNCIYAGAEETSPLPHTPVLASVQGFAGIPVWVKKEALLHSGLHRESVSASRSSAKASATRLSRGLATTALLLFPELLGTRHLPPSPGAGCILATSSKMPDLLFPSRTPSTAMHSNRRAAILPPHLVAMVMGPYRHSLSPAPSTGA